MKINQPMGIWDINLTSMPTSAKLSSHAKARFYGLRVVLLTLYPAARAPSSTLGQKVAVDWYTREPYWGFPKEGYPQIIHVHGIFPYKPSILGHPPCMETPICTIDTEIQYYHLLGFFLTDRYGLVILMSICGKRLSKHFGCSICCNLYKWGFPKIGVPLNHPHLIGFSLINQPFLGTPFMETPKSPESDLPVPSSMLSLKPCRTDFGILSDWVANWDFLFLW